MNNFLFITIFPQILAKNETEREKYNENYMQTFA